MNRNVGESQSPTRFTHRHDDDDDDDDGWLAGKLPTPFPNALSADRRLVPRARFPLSPPPPSDASRRGRVRRARRRCHARRWCQPSLTPGGFACLTRPCGGLPARPPAKIPLKAASRRRHDRLVTPHDSPQVVRKSSRTLSLSRTTSRQVRVWAGMEDRARDNALAEIPLHPPCLWRSHPHPPHSLQRALGTCGGGDSVYGGG
jgi:hypothetical protein